jgi:hypothetical protein
LRRMRRRLFSALMLDPINLTSVSVHVCLSERPQTTHQNVLVPQTGNPHTEKSDVGE